ncbi:Sphingosine N-acyltransferase-like protein ALT7 [Fulvia fulva]|uniref:Sphingosine N-acyltransferase-like protein ALT7 n=1 Tax=Passalora fulva TaxID=5499 RepID=A0A9Q8LH78_PASFU|nr:Sphingosine N-acyltransferase-like protein ALT7 [Fulvia fulva]KAK4624633.1 Sphingosine N-acyltransferase-like protein ALT7 [Fulvia fulva]UJO17571.1 Sphingosine N-acyltransferase-like protein ALT7 [Fulvia fulva]WPV15180.1 Sphingosine N-acyltransferase-like protein ALT7 [Fulvia fulva]WPV30182.1 Sphingosine N-acyltransferase-like protein ALT7 [Fulvia fulva]
MSLEEPGLTAASTTTTTIPSKASPTLECPPAPKPRNTPPPHRDVHREVRFENMAVCASPGDYTPPKRRSTWSTADDESIWSWFRKIAMQHQLGLSLNVILLLTMSHVMFPSLRDITKACFQLSYPAQVEGQYSQGSRDMYFVASFVVFFTGIRAFMLDYVLIPLATKCGIGRRKGKVRFAEQAYMLIYYAIYWSWGLYLFVQDTPKEVNNVESLLISLWRDFPRLTLGTGMKLYYLTQFAFWIQQIVVIHLEERRKDHYQMLTHHFVTCGLMLGSYGYRQWRVGNAILVLMDIVDLIFPAAKILRYLGMQTACDAAFGLFVVAWVFARHVCYLSVCWSIYAHVHVKTMHYGVYSTETGKRLSTEGGDNLVDNLLQPLLKPEAKTFAFNANIRWSFLGLLVALQCITLAWLVMIIRVVMRVLRGHGADDTRSDDEGEDEEIEDGPAQPSKHNVPIKAEEPRFIEVETTSDEVTWPTRKGSSSNRKKSKGISSGLNLGEHKDILNRIGCLSEEQLARERELREGTGSPRPTSAAGKR